MPRNFKLTWQPGKDGRAGRWLKKYRGHRYYFSGGTGKYDREAYEAALDAWDQFKIKLDQQAPRPHQREYEHAIDEWEQVLAWCGKNGERQMAETAAGKLENLRKRLTSAVLKPLEDGDRFEAQLEWPTVDLDEALSKANPAAMAHVRLPAFGRLDPSTMGAAIDGSPVRIAKEVWQDRLDVQRRKAAFPEGTLQTHVGCYLRERERQAEAGELSLGHLYSLRLRLTQFQDWLGKNTAVTDIDGKTLTGYRAELLGKVARKKWTRTTAKHHLGSVKAFVRWLWQIEAIPTLPRVMDSRGAALSIGESVGKIIVFTKEEIKALLDGGPDRTRLFILLMLNCGMTQKDISDLHVSEVDWDQGRIIRRRSKTEDCENVPIVNYLLWPETFRLLKQERAKRSKDRVLVNANGSPLCFEKFSENGTYRKTDNIKNAFDRLRKPLKILKPLKSLKKTSASLLRDSAQFSSLEHLFLGHAPMTMADRHYARVPQRLLDQAIEWLGRQYKPC